jgi:hypothetical protein
MRLDMNEWYLEIWYKILLDTWSMDVWYGVEYNNATIAETNPMVEVYHILLK